MELITGGNEPVTREDLRNLQLTMMAGFQLCLEELQIIIGLQKSPDMDRWSIEQLIFAQRERFAHQMDMACQQILNREQKE